MASPERVVWIPSQPQFFTGLFFPHFQNRKLPVRFVSLINNVNVTNYNDQSQAKGSCSRLIRKYDWNSHVNLDMVHQSNLESRSEVLRSLFLRFVEEDWYSFCNDSGCHFHKSGCRKSKVTTPWSCRQLKRVKIRWNLTEVQREVRIFSFRLLKLSF